MSTKPCPWCTEINWHEGEKFRIQACKICQKPVIILYMHRDFTVEEERHIKNYWGEHYKILWNIHGIPGHGSAHLDELERKSPDPVERVYLGMELKCPGCGIFKGGYHHPLCERKEEPDGENSKRDSKIR